MHTWAKQKGFTIVELLIVIVVIAILAAVIIVAFRGVQQRAVQASLQSDVDKGRKKIMLYQTENGTYPTAINCPSPGTTEICVQASGNNTYNYQVNNSVSPPQFALNAVNGAYAASATSSQDTGIVTDSLVARLDAGDSVSYSGQGTVWKDASGNGRDTALINTTFSPGNWGTMAFNGSSSYAIIPSITARSVFMFVYIDAGQVASRYLIDARPGSGSGYIYSRGVGSWTNFYVNGLAVTVAYASIPTGAWIGFYAETTAQFTSTINLMSRYSNNEFLAGKLGPVMVYNRALTPAEISQNFNALKGRYGL